MYCNGSVNNTTQHPCLHIFHTTKDNDYLCVALELVWEVSVLLLLVVLTEYWNGMFNFIGYHPALSKVHSKPSEWF